MLQEIIDAFYYCFFREKEAITTDSVIDHLEKLSDHELKLIMNRFVKQHDVFKACC